MMHHSRHESEHTTVGLSGGATFLWAITKEWKIRYDQPFKAWDEYNIGFVGGDIASEMMA